MTWKYQGPDWRAYDHARSAQIWIETGWPNGETKTYHVEASNVSFAGMLKIIRSDKLISIYVGYYFSFFEQHVADYPDDASRIEVFMYHLDGLIELHRNKPLIGAGRFVTDLDRVTNPARVNFTPPSNDELWAYQKQAQGHVSMLSGGDAQLDE